MNQILQKCLIELAKDTPRIDYVRGMLETLLEMQGTPVALPQPIPTPVARLSSDPEAAMLDGFAIAQIGKMPPLETE